MGSARMGSPVTTENLKHIMRFIVIFLSALCLISFANCQESCDRGEECIAARDCDSFTRDRETLKTLKGKPGYSTLRDKLRSQVCNKRSRRSAVVVPQAVTRQMKTPPATYH